MPRPKKYPIALSDHDILQIKAVMVKPGCSKTVRDRCRILLELDENRGRGKAVTHEQCAKELGVSAATVTNIVRLYYAQGLERVITLNRNENSNGGRRGTLSAEEKAPVRIARGISPMDGTKWRLRFVREKLRVELELSEMQSKLHWYLPNRADAEYAAAMEDVLSLYALPNQPKRPVICMSEKTYRFSEPSEETRSVFAYMEPLGGKRHFSVREHRSAHDWAEEVKYIADVAYADAEKIRIVLDSTGTHAAASLYKRYPPEEAKRIVRRVELHYTPKGGGWLNLAEVELAVMQQLLDEAELGRRFASREYGGKENEVSVWWQMTVGKARERLSMVYPRMEDGN